MKKALIIFIILFAATLIVPMISIAQSGKKNSGNELVTIFSSAQTAVCCADKNEASQSTAFGSVVYTGHC